MSLSRAELVAIDKRRVWHPYTEMGSYIAETDPRSSRGPRGRGSTTSTESYLDANSSWWVASLGHNHPRLVGALARQAKEMCHCALAGITHPEAALLADELCRIAPRGLERVFFSDIFHDWDDERCTWLARRAAESLRPRRRRFVALEGLSRRDRGAARPWWREVF